MADQSSSEVENDRNPSRRTLLKGAAVGAGALWVTPVVETVLASPAGASPAGCAACTSPNLAPTTLAALNAGSTNLITPAFTTGTQGGSGTGAYNANFDPTCITRLNRPTTSQPQARATFSATIDKGSSASSAILRFYSGPSQTGSETSTTITTTLNQPTLVSQTVDVPIGTQSFRIDIVTGARNGGGNSPGSVTGLTLTLTC